MLMTNFTLERALELKNRAAAFLLFFLTRCKNQQIQVVSGYLAYVTLMSLVPLIVVMFSIITAFPIFSDFKLLLEDFVYANFVPTAGDVVQEHLSGFVKNTSRMSAIAIGFLFVFALLLISVIDKSLNQIWQVKKKRRIITSFSMYWMILTLGPVLVGGSIAVSSYILSLVSFSDQSLIGVSNFFLRLVPLLSSVAAFLILYLVVPNKVVRFTHALSGALLAGVLFELAKKGFAFYVTQLPSYQVIYGALATIPILFVWVYLSWLVVLIGAVFTVTIDDYQKEFPMLDEEHNA